MEFAGVKPEQLGRVKVTSVSECFLAEKGWQTVTRRGAVLACVGVPTVRKIEVELLMRAKNRSALPLLLEKVRAWLEESGEEKLHFDSMGGTYYKARCTGTEALTYSGASARLKVTFTCVDYRRYRLYDDKPVGGADPVCGQLYLRRKALFERHGLHVRTRQGDGRSGTCAEQI